MSKTKEIVILSLLLAIAIVLYAVEALLPMSFVIPGAKLGLANVITLFALLYFGFKNGITILILRIIIASLLIGTFLTVGFFLSLTGGILGFLVMSYIYYFHYDKFSIVGISVLGAAFHNLGQIIMAALLIENWRIIFYLPYLLLISLPTGVFVAIVVLKLNKYLEFDLINMQEIKSK